MRKIYVDWPQGVAIVFVLSKQLGNTAVSVFNVVCRQDFVVSVKLETHFVYLRV